MRTALFGVLVACGPVLWVGSAMGQDIPSADTIIDKLAPSLDRPVGHLVPQSSSSAASAPLRPPVIPPAAPSVNLIMQFGTSSTQLTPASIRTLDELGRALSSQSLSAYRFRIEGHTDTVGDPERNQALSKARARRVVAYLVAKFHVDASRLEPIGLGEAHLLVPTGEQVAEPRNRCVTVVNLGA